VDKVAAYKLLLRDHPLWEKTALSMSALWPVGGAAIGGTMGGVGGYFSTDDKKERRKNALVGGVVGGAVGGFGGEVARRFGLPKSGAPGGAMSSATAPKSGSPELGRSYEAGESGRGFEQYPRFERYSPKEQADKASFVENAIKQHKDDYLRYEVGLLGVKHRLTPAEVTQILGGGQPRDAAPTLRLGGAGAPRWGPGDIDYIISKNKGFGVEVPSGGALIDARVSRGARDQSRAEAQKRISEFLATRRPSAI